MPVPVEVSPAILEKTIAASQDHLLSIQHPDGYWWADLESNVTMTAEVVLLHKIWGTDATRPMEKAKNFIRSQQRDHGGWELFFGDGGDLSTSIEAYTALRLLGVAAEDPDMVRAKAFVLARGGVSKSRIFTKLHLALIGCFDWQGLPSLPPWVMLLPNWSPVNIYEMSSWARGSTVPLLIVMDRKPIFPVSPRISVDELYLEGRAKAPKSLPRKGDWTDLFIDLDGLFKFGESLNLVPFREEGIKTAERWVVERQEATGDWGGIIPQMLNSLLALKALNYHPDDPVVRRGMAAVDRFGLEKGDTYWVQPCISPVWDTAIVMRALMDGGLAPDHPAIVKAGEWLLEKQIVSAYGDWAVKNKQGEPGGWAFEFENRYYPDVDDSAMVVMALMQAKLPDENLKKQAIARCVRWIATMQCRPGGWGAFDIDNDQDWLNQIPYGDLKAMIDPNTADVTARVLEMVGLGSPSTGDTSVARALEYLRNEQEAEGCWFGRWGVNYVYGTSGVVCALAKIAPKSDHPRMLKAANWLSQVQNEDGGWGETCSSYTDPNLKGVGPSTASQTAWGLMGLLAVGEATGNFDWDAIDRGVAYLAQTQQEDGKWDEDHFTGTGFPGHFYLKYHLYQQEFPLMALGRYAELKHLKQTVRIPLKMEQRDAQALSQNQTTEISIDG
jgi:squalene-hopene/tetraprenyl-beta-curcumene cyclase